MIAIIHKGADFGNAAEYLFGPGKNGDHVAPHVVTGANGRLAVAGPARYRGAAGNQAQSRA